MSRLRHPILHYGKRWGWFLPLLLLAAPVAAHKTQISGSVGATQHIEPNDNPRAGEPSVAWYALTRQGGETIPLEACNCNLAVYNQPYTPGDVPILEPPLKPISAEGYQNIPGTEITFPEVGAYDVILRGEPTTAGDFQPFELEFEVTVAVGTAEKPDSEAIAQSPIAKPSSPTEATQPSATDSQPRQANSLWIGAIVVAVLLIGGFWALARQVRADRRL
jgi:hypothetical protein